MSTVTDWQPCSLDEHLAEVRRVARDVRSTLEEAEQYPLIVHSTRFLDDVCLCLAAVDELIEHTDGLHEDDVLARILHEPEEDTAWHL